MAIIFSAVIGKILISLFTGSSVLDWWFWIILLLFLVAAWFTFGNILKSKNDQILETKTNLNDFFGYLRVIGIVLFILVVVGYIVFLLIWAIGVGAL